MRRSGFVVAIFGALLLAGCTSAPAASDLDEMATSTVDPNSTPGFVETAQRESDMLSATDLTGLGIAPDSTRYQGSWDGFDVYLGVSGESTVNLITVEPSDRLILSSGQSVGNTVIALGDPISLQYLPQGTATVPRGWHPLTPWVIVRD